LASGQLSDNTIGDYHFNYTRLELIYKAELFTNLSQREAELLKLLLENKNDLLDKRTTLLKIWEEDTIFNSRSMDVYITRLRKYLLNDTSVEIINVRGKGYKLVD
jgi:DNA-binding response OmpR family regulator